MKGKHLAVSLLMAGIFAVTPSDTTTTVMAAEASGQQTVQENVQEDPMPESYEWEIQSNSIPGWPQGPKVIAETAILMDLDTGEILYAKGIDEKRAPASTTKIMTAMLAIEKVPLDTQITFTDEVNNIEPDSTHIGIKPGETLTMEQSLYAILLASANEVSSGVAEYIGGTVPEFVDMMNERAKELGCENTHFVNANGLYSEDHYTTARDMALIAQAAFRDETFRNITKSTYYIIPPTNITSEQRWLDNHHKMLVQGSQHYDGCLGGKTGYTVKAGNTLVTYAEKNSMRLVCVVLAGTTEYYNDTRSILDYGFNNFQKLSLASDSLKEGDSFALYLKEEGLLDEALQNASADVPVNPSQDITCEAKVENNRLDLDFYYGDTLLSSSSQQATQEILEASRTFEQQQRQSRQISQESSGSSKDGGQKQQAEEPEKISDTDGPFGGFFQSVAETFQSLPSWKYAAAALLAAAFLFYIILLIVKIKRIIRSRKRKRARRKKKEK